MDFVNFDFINKFNIPNIQNKNNINQNNLEKPKFTIENKQFINNKMNRNSNGMENNNPKLYNIKINQMCLYIENITQCCTIKILKSFERKINIVDNENEIMNINPYKIVKADAIIGIFNINKNKYLGIVTSSTEITYFMDSYLYCINSIELIKITSEIEHSSDLNTIRNIKNFFSTGNFYYSNNYDLSLSFNSQAKANNSRNGNNDFNDVLNYKYIVNSSLLKYFLINQIPEFFFCKIIFGYVGCQDENNLSKEFNMDIIIIERYIINNLFINNDIPGYIKQIELISNYKNKPNKNLSKIFSFICYFSSESSKHINKFLPFKQILIEELDQYKNIICIINNINIKDENNNMKVDNIIRKNNNNLLKNKINQILFISDFKNKIIFDNINKDIDFYSNFSNNYQNNIFWFIEINNIHSDNDTSFNIAIKIFSKIIQKGIMDIELLNQKNIDFLEQYKIVINNKLNEIKIKYKNNLIYIKKPLLLKNRENNQEIIDKFLGCSKNYNNNNESNNKLNINKFNYSVKCKNMKNINGFKKLKILCITWNIGGLPYDYYDISNLFKENNFFLENKSPDIIIISIQEIVKLNIKNIISPNSSTNQENILSWKQLLKINIETIYSQENYHELISLNLVGIFIFILIKIDLKNNILLLDHNITKRGMYGTLGNKGFFAISIQCYNKIISIGTGHFEAGKEKNDQRINTLIQLLNKPINIQEDELITFKDSDYWIILGDLNFRIELSYEDAISFIKDKSYDILYAMDQFNSSREKNDFLKNNVYEKTINFDPTYKYEKNSDNYAYDENKIRVPGWTDRIFFNNKEGIKMINYDCIKSLKFSDHRPVVGTFEIDVFSDKEENINSNLNNIKKNRLELIDSEETENNIYQNQNLNGNNDNNKKKNNIEDINNILISNNNEYNDKINKNSLDNQKFYNFLINNENKSNNNNNDNIFNNPNILNNNYNNNQNIFNNSNIQNNNFNFNNIKHMNQDMTFKQINNFNNNNNFNNQFNNIPNYNNQMNNNLNMRFSLQNNSPNYNNQLNNNMNMRFSIQNNNNFNNQVNSYSFNNNMNNNINNNFNI